MKIKFLARACAALLLAAPPVLLAAPTVATAATVGPNAYGYVGHPVAYDFVSGIPTSVNLALSGAYDAEVTVALPWAFSWHGQPYSTVTVGATGGISFTPGAELGWTNSCLPAYGLSSSDGAPDIAPFWDNVQPAEGGSVYAWEDAANGRFIISWEGVPHTSGGTSGVSFQAHLYSTGELQFHYADTTFGSSSYDGGTSATVGIQDASGGSYDALQWSCSDDVLFPGQALAFHACGDWDGDGYISDLCGGLDCEDTQASVNPGQTTDVCDGFDTDCDGVFAVGSTSGAESSTSSGTSSSLTRGLKWLVTSDVTLETAEIYLSSSSSITFHVYESSTQSGPFTRIHQSSGSASSSGSWRMSSPLNVSLSAGNYYIVAASWSGSRTYYWSSSANFSSLPCAFGSIISGATYTSSSPPSSYSFSDAANSYRFRINVAGESDADGDGWASCNGDCDDADPASFPGAIEVCDGVDNDCDGSSSDEYDDGDFDGYGVCEDCDDGDSSVNPGVTAEGCDYIDTDCDGAAGPDEIDNDGDGLDECTGDCDDTNAAIVPGAVETCDGVDNDCDGVVPADEDDADFDGWRLCEGDCDDGLASVNPDAIELCDGLDTDCDGSTPSTEGDVDGDGVMPCLGDCDDGDDASYPGAAEVCDGADNDCDGYVPADEEDEDADEQFPCSGDCDDGDATIYDGAPELCDGLDNNCNGTSEDENVDDDGDGVSACEGDCDDTTSDVSPTNTEDTAEYCFDLLDNDCDGDTDGADADCDGIEPPGDDDDDSVGDDDDAADDDDGGGSRGGGTRRGCSFDGGGGGPAWLLVLAAGVAMRRRR